MEQFKVFRAIGLSFKAWFANFIPFTLLAGILYAPALYKAWTIPSVTDLDSLNNWVKQFQYTVWLVVGFSTLLAPLLTYRVIQYMNGSKSSFVDSLKHGVRGVIPAVLLAGVTTVVQMVPFGGIISTIMLCYWFVVAPVAVVERLNPVAEFGRANQLTQGRRWGIFGLCLLLNLVVIVVTLMYLGPMLAGKVNSMDEIQRTVDHFVKAIVPLAAVYQMFLGIVQAVSYSLLRADKDGVSNEELAKVFE